jgi:hypothetical protein
MAAPLANGEPGPPERDPAKDGEPLTAQMGVAGVPPDVIGPPDYEFGPPPGAEAPDLEGPASEAPSEMFGGFPAAPGPEGVHFSPGMKFSPPGAPGDETAAWANGTDTPGTWISDTPEYPAAWDGQQVSDVPGFPMAQQPGATTQLPAPDGVRGDREQMAPPPPPPPPPPAPLPGNMPGAGPGTVPAGGPGAGPGTHPTAPMAWPPPPPQFQAPAGPGMEGGFTGQPPFPPVGHPFAPPRRKGRKKLLAIGAAVVALAVAAAGVVLMNKHSASHPPPDAPSPSHSPTAPTRLASKIDNVKTDPKPITKSEIFPDLQVSAGGRQFVRVAIAMNHNCSKSARGSFARALTADKCERVVRATYVDSAKRFAVTAGVAALPTKTLAKRANRAKRLKHNIWFMGLDGGKGSSAQMVSRSGGYAYGIVDGRYIIFGFATYSNGHMPTGKTHQDQVLNALSRVFAQLAHQPINVRALG